MFSRPDGMPSSSFWPFLSVLERGRIRCTSDRSVTERSDWQGWLNTPSLSGTSPSAVATFDVWNTIETSGLRTSTTYRCSKARKSHVVAEASSRPPGCRHTLPEGSVPTSTTMIGATVRPNKIKQMWRAGQYVTMGWLSISHGITAEVMARQGFDTLCIDMQHGTTEMNDVCSTPAGDLADRHGAGRAGAVEGPGNHYEGAGPGRLRDHRAAGQHRHGRSEGRGACRYRR